ncbi:hypothetical protein FACS1894124_5000 [Spirochaetia bacterium]|nr:hypothetical protein FACS1894124_5000 [Spirochaetia bacterium]
MKEGWYCSYNKNYKYCDGCVGDEGLTIIDVTPVYSRSTLGHEKGDICPAYHRKHPTPEQFREEYGYSLPLGFPVAVKKCGYEWAIQRWFISHDYWKQYKYVVCLCNPYGVPPYDFEVTE